MLKRFRPTDVQRRVSRCGGLLIASALVLWLVANSPVIAQEHRMPPIRGGVEERVGRDLPTAQELSAPPLKGGVDESFERGLPPIGDRSDRSYEEDCRAFQELMELNRKALRSPEVTRSQAWHDAEHNLFDHTSSNISSEFHRYLMMHCHCPVVSGRARIEQWWEEQIRRRNAPQDARTQSNWDVQLQQVLEHLETEIKRTEACYKKACGEPAPPTTQASDQSPCPPSTLAVTASGPLRRPAPRGEPAPADLQRELEALRVDLDRFWQEQFERNGRLLYTSPSRLIQCRERNCFYQPPNVNDPEGAVLYNPEHLLGQWKRYGRMAVVHAMAHEFGHNVEYKSSGKFRSDPERELLADRLAGVYLAHLHRQGIVVSDRPFDASGSQGPRRSPCPEDDMRAVRAFLTGAEDMGDPGLAFFFRGGVGHSIGKMLGMPDLHGFGVERWVAFRDGYRNGIPPDLFRLPWEVR